MHTAQLWNEHPRKVQMQHERQMINNNLMFLCLQVFGLDFVMIIVSVDCMKGGSTAAGAAQVDLELTEIQWKMPHITLFDHVKIGIVELYIGKSKNYYTTPLYGVNRVSNTT